MLRAGSDARSTPCSPANARTRPSPRHASHETRPSRLRELHGQALLHGGAVDRTSGPDRKSVVYGQRVSVSVYLGGLRIFKKNKTNQHTQSNTTRSQH